MSTVYDDEQQTSSAPAPVPRTGRGPTRPAPSGAAVIFGEDAALFDRFRPGYPRELMETIVQGTAEGRPVLEIGAGTGKATRALLALGRTVHAVEPDPRMADLLEMNCHGAPLTVTRAALETADLPYEAFPLVVAAQSWHWIDPEVSYARVSDCLETNGRLALLWHRPVPEQGIIGEALARIHAALAPGITALWPGWEAPDIEPARQHVGAAARFRGWTRHEHRWQRRVDAKGLVGWLCTSAPHRLLPVQQRFDVMSAVATVVEELGGEVIVDMRTVALIGYRV